MDNYPLSHALKFLHIFRHIEIAGGVLGFFACSHLSLYWVCLFRHSLAFSPPEKLLQKTCRLPSLIRTRRRMNTGWGSRLQKSRKSHKLENVSKLQGMVLGVVAILPRHKIHNIKSNLVAYHHLEGFWDWSTYNRFRGMITMSTNYETPCRKRISSWIRIGKLK